MRKLSRILFASLLVTSLLVHMHAKTKTKLGVFSLPTPELFEQAQLEVTRTILKDFQIREIYAGLDAGKTIDQIKWLRIAKAFEDAGVHMIVTLRWPMNGASFKNGSDIVNGVVDPKAMLDRVPEGEDRKQSLALLKRFLNDFGDWFDVISLQNETLGGPGKYQNKDTKRPPDGFSPAGRWLIEVAETVDAMRRSNPKLAHLKISSPVWNGVDRIFRRDVMIPEHHSNPKIRLLGEIVKISNSHCDYVDIHPLSISITELPEIIAYVKKHTDLPLITTEWNGLYGVREWMNEPVAPQILEQIEEHFPEFQEQLGSNREFIRLAHEQKTPLKLWDAFLKTVPHEKDFALRSFKLFEEEDFIYACWALGYQYNNHVFDLKTLFANIVTRESYAPNGPAFDDFQRVIEYSGGTPWKF